MPKKRFLPLLILFLLFALGYALAQKPLAPAVRFTTLAGQPLDLTQLRGHVVLVNFWATTCPGCVAEMPKLVETYKLRHAQGFELVAVAMSDDVPEQIRQYVAMHALPFAVTHDSQGLLAHAFNDVRLTPTAILIDKRGRIVRTSVGELDFVALDRQLEQELRRAI